jgi:hypothetical protein
MNKSPETHLKKSQALLELAKNNKRLAHIKWRSIDLGEWEKVDPSWRVVNGKIRFQFNREDRIQFRWAVSVRQKSWGIRVLLKDDGTPVLELFDVAWKESIPESETCSSELWKIVRHWLKTRFPGHRIVKASKRSHPAKTISGLFLRVQFHQAGVDRFLIAADEKSEGEIHKAVGQALLWVSNVIAGKKLKRVPAVDILVPSGISASLFHRSRLLNKNRIKVEVWEYRGKNNGDEIEVTRAPVPDPPEENKDFRWPVLGPFRWSSQLEQVLNLAPSLIRRYPRFCDYDSLRLWGLEFAQVTGPDRDRIFFGVGEQRTELREDNFDCLKALIEEIIYFRRPDSPDVRHPYYRLQAERWLEAMVLEDVQRLFPELAPESVYSQIPVYLGKESGRIDILGTDRLGTLAVIELKVTADPDLPVQALDYWGRVIQHNDNGDFERRGYFSEIRLSRNRPCIYLVSPVFSFHDTTECLLRYLDPGLEVWKISINEDWRFGIKIMRRIRYRCREF